MKLCAENSLRKTRSFVETNLPFVSYRSNCSFQFQFLPTCTETVVYLKILHRFPSKLIDCERTDFISIQDYYRECVNFGRTIVCHMTQKSPMDFITKLRVYRIQGIHLWKLDYDSYDLQLRIFNQTISNQLQFILITLYHYLNWAITFVTS